MTSVLYISYDGALEPLGESQVVTYIERLASRHPITLLSFEKSVDLADSRRVAALRHRLAQAGIRWLPLRYHKRPTLLATAWDVARGTAVAIREARRRGVGIAHARGYVAALIALALRRFCGVRFLFDMRGFWPDEKVDAGHWAADSRIYRLTKRCERTFFSAADAIVSLTAAGITTIRDLGYPVRRETPMEVITTCTDLRRFAPGPRDAELAARLGVTGGPVIGCVGTMSNWYLREPTLRYLAYLMSVFGDLTALVVTQEDHDVLRRDAIEAGVPAARLRITSATFRAMPDHVRLMDVGLFFIKPAFSKKGSMATKLGEFLATGVPVIINDGVGDSGDIVRKAGVGVVLSDVTDESFRGSRWDVETLLQDPDVARRCRVAAAEYFDVEQGVKKYDALYAALLRADARGVVP
jgi:glycosyltransferase involved in cell wall biosynthesis